MTPKLVSATYLKGYRIQLEFADGKSGIVDLKDDLWGEVFAPLKDPAQFRNFRIDHELGTIVWPTGADLAPEFLYSAAA